MFKKVVLILSFLLGIIVLNADEVKITPEADADSGDDFGFSVAISGDWSVVGARGEDDNGAAYFFKHNGESWVREDVYYGSGTETDYDQLGQSVSICGDYAIVGAPRDEWFDGIAWRETGTAKVFQRDGDSWTLLQTLTPPNQANDKYMQWYGESVSVDGDRAIVGGPGYSDGVMCIGIAYIYHLNGDSWRFPNPEPDWHENFGQSVSISGDYAIVGTPGDNNETGKAYIFHYDNGDWNQQAELTAEEDADNGDYFGYSVSINEDYAVIGAYNDSAQGSAYIFHRDGILWTRQTRVLADDGQSCDLFGVSVSINGDNLLVGAADDGDNGSFSGSAYFFLREGTSWIQQEKYLAIDGSIGDSFGYSVSINEEKLIVGAPEHSGGTNNGGYVYIYDLFGQAQVGDIIITEIMQNPLAVNDFDGEWFEIFNRADHSIDMADWIFTDNGANTFTVSGSFIVPSQEYAIFTINDDPVTNGGVNYSRMYDWGTSANYALSNSTDAIIIGNGAKAEIDRVEWDNGITFPNSEGASMVFEGPYTDNNAYLDNNSGSNWQQAASDTYGSGDSGSPGSLGGDAALPVSLSSFTASYQNNSTSICWQTQSETENQGWNIYRSDSENFGQSVKINYDLIPGSGTTSIATDYHYNDDFEAQNNENYWYWLEHISFSGVSELSEPIIVEIHIEPDNPIPPSITDFGLKQNYPNPFNPSTTIDFSLTTENAKNAMITIFNLKGEKIRQYSILNNQSSVAWDGKDENNVGVSSGIYLYQLKTDNFSQIKKAVLMK